jgi:branched-chain amino acid transport system ATP-binding protein
VGLEVAGLDAWYGQAQVLRGITLSVPDHSVVGLFGHNGAGKTTLLRAIARVHRQCSGRIALDGRDLSSARADQAARAGVRLVREGARVFDVLTVEEQLLLGARLSARPAAAVLDEVYDRFPVLRTRRRQQGGLLSGGQRQMLALGVALAGDPRCLLLDEPSTGLAPAVVDELYETIRTLAGQGRALLIAEQASDHLPAIAHHSHLLETGELRPVAAAAGNGR